MNMRRKEKQQQAIERGIIRDNRTPEQQLCLIKTRRGESKKERARLEKLIASKANTNKEKK
jgi:hypothetical protein